MHNQISLLIASNNKHKTSEIKEIFDTLLPGVVCLVSPKEAGADTLDPEETGSTLEENAFIKAKAFFEKSGIPAFADDTGLEIDVLDGKPGVFSARFAGEHGNDKANRELVLKLLHGKPENQRTASFRTVICFFNGSKPVFIDGICSGKIGFLEQGSGGFGYDSIFIPDGFNKTFAEMSPAEKNSISHRRNAVKAFAEYIEKNL